MVDNMQQNLADDHGHSGLSPEATKRRNHAEAQRRYRERNLAQTRTKARLRMERLREETSLSAEASAASVERRRVVDADYRERQRKRKFIEKFGHRAFIRHYLPLHDIFGPHLPGQKFVLDKTPAASSHSKAQRTKREKRAKNSKQHFESYTAETAPPLGRLKETRCVESGGTVFANEARGASGAPHVTHPRWKWTCAAFATALMKVPGSPAPGSPGGFDGFAIGEPPARAIPAPAPAIPAGAGGVGRAPAPGGSFIRGRGREGVHGFRPTPSTQTEEAKGGDVQPS
ncbi:hypothetical protein C8R46DRAFT_1038072 [Mycena filopes]|nr:hypothetical protein C8R46DRAFT_1038072 [Mycena filopes]